jgi:hypothetical protein
MRKMSGTMFLKSYRDSPFICRDISEEYLSSAMQSRKRRKPLILEKRPWLISPLFMEGSMRKSEIERHMK